MERPGTLSDTAIIGLLVTGWAVVLMVMLTAYAYRADLMELGSAALGSLARSQEITDVRGFLAARQYDRAKVVTGGPTFQAGAAGIPLTFVAHCLGSPTPFGIDRKLSVVDLGDDQFRLMFRTNGVEVGLHVRMLGADRALFDEIEARQETTTSPVAMEAFLFPLVALCEAAEQSKKVRYLLRRPEVAGRRMTAFQLSIHQAAIQRYNPVSSCLPVSVGRQFKAHPKDLDCPS